MKKHSRKQWKKKEVRKKEVRRKKERRKKELISDRTSRIIHRDKTEADFFFLSLSSFSPLTLSSFLSSFSSTTDEEWGNVSSVVVTVSFIFRNRMATFEGREMQPKETEEKTTAAHLHHPFSSFSSNAANGTKEEKVEEQEKKEEEKEKKEEEKEKKEIKEREERNERKRSRKKNLNVCALILTRGSSKSIPGKNIRSFNGHPLIVHSLQTVLQCQCKSLSFSFTLFSLSSFPFISFPSFSHFFAVFSSFFLSLSL